MVPPELCISASAASPYVQVYFVFVIFVLSYCYCFLASVCAFPWVSCVALAPPTGHRNAGFVFVFVFCFCFVFVLSLFCFVFAFLALCLYPLCFFCCVFVFRLGLSCRPSLGPSPGHIIGLIVPTNSNLVPSGLGLRPEHMLILVSVFLPSLFFSFPFCFLPFLSLGCPSSSFSSE